MNPDVMMMSDPVMTTTAMNSDVLLTNDILGGIGIFAGIVIFLTMIFIPYLMKAYGLFVLNQKLGENHAWLAWVPVVNIYSFVKAAGKSGWWVLFLIIGFILFVIPGVVMYIYLCHCISKRVGRTGWTTAVLVFFNIVGFPQVAVEYKPEEKSNKDSVIEL
jgi:hypothetical protein